MVNSLLSVVELECLRVNQRPHQVLRPWLPPVERLAEILDRELGFATPSHVDGSGGGGSSGIGGGGGFPNAASAADMAP